MNPGNDTVERSRLKNVTPEILVNKLNARTNRVLIKSLSDVSLPSQNVYNRCFACVKQMHLSPY